MEPTYFCLVTNGIVQYWAKANGDKYFPVAKTRADAARLARWWKSDASPAQIGSVSGETLEGHITAAVDAGCVAFCCPQRWNSDGSPVWGFIKIT